MLGSACATAAHGEATHMRDVTSAGPAGRALGDETLAGWLAAQRARCDMAVREIPWRDSREWRFDGDAFRHHTGAFFSVVGARMERAGAALPGLEQPLLDQPEIGILGFLVRDAAGGVELLVQAKPEPGNVGLVQAAPSVQATVSNYLRRHRGKPTPHLERFTEPAPGAVLADSLQSEQGTRFLGKRNRNVVVRVADEAPIADAPALRWAPAAELRALLGADFQVNTDARSVLVCAPWRLLADGGAPFSRWAGSDAFGAALLRSHAAVDGDPFPLACERLAALREAAGLATRTVALTALADWRLDETGLLPAAGQAFAVRFFAVRTTAREVERWDQPLACGLAEGAVTLLCAERAGVLRFLFVARPEPGFGGAFQLGPSLQSDGHAAYALPSHAALEAALGRLAATGEELVANRQSDEGGRFHRSVARYAVVRVAPGAGPADGGPCFWLTLGEVADLVRRPELFTNEARSALSLLLSCA